MSKIKTVFELDVLTPKSVNGNISIIGYKPKYIPYIKVNIGEGSACIKDEDLERFAVNILRSLKSKRLKK